MKYRKMEKTGDLLSILGFGCMRFPTKRGSIHEEKARAQIIRAIDKGVNYFDTALPYHMGQSELFLGKVLEEEKLRDKVKIADKLPPWSVKTREDMDHILGSQLKSLRTGKIDYYLVHALNAESWPKMKDLGVLDFLDRAKSDGRIVNAGFSYHASGDLFKEIVDSYDWDFCQIQYNYLDEEYQAGTKGLEYASSRGMGVIVMEPLRGGHLGKQPPLEIQDLWKKAPVKRSPGEWALRWVWNRPDVNLLLSGMTLDEHLEENLKIADDVEPGSLAEEELDIIHLVRDRYRSLTKAGCTGCAYCMPCPVGVNIPGCLEIYNNRFLFRDKAGSFLQYSFRIGVAAGSGRASNCIKCGKCEKKCPQNLPIINLLEETTKEFEGLKHRILVFFARFMINRQRKKAKKKAEHLSREVNND